MNLKEPLKAYFGYDEFKDGQEKLIKGILRGRDVLGIMPTGGGKSLCYQLPATVTDGITLVISPLISLMKDQIDSLNELGINSVYINSTLENNEIIEISNEIRRNKYKIVYVAPERLNAPSFMNLVSELKISIVAIDEAHCISQWGHDFRPSYMGIPKFIDSLKIRPVVAAFTATATKEIIEEIKKLIGLENPIEALTGFDRPNLYYRVVKTGKKFNYLLDYLDDNFQNESGIIYCATRKTVESLVEKLNDKGFDSVGYHGGMEAEKRQRNQDDFIFGRKRIIVATNAFGMGIDKPDVRFVIHYNMPKNMEAYYQEAGRAGRDGNKSDCILMYSPSDIVKQKLIIQNESLSDERQEVLYKNLQYLINYCHIEECLRNKILTYFGEETEVDNCGNCSNCLDNAEVIDVTIEAQKILSCIYRVNQRYGTNTIIQILRGSNNKKLLETNLDRVSTYGIMKDYNNNDIREIIMNLTSKGYIHITTDKYPILKLTQSSRKILKGEVKVFHKVNMINKKLEENEKLKKSEIDKDKIFDKQLFEKLKELRNKIASEKNLPSYIIFKNDALKDMAVYYPQNEETFLKIKGVGEAKLDSYGQEFIQLIKTYCHENNIEAFENKILRDEINIDEKNKSTVNRYELTYDCYLEGLSLKEIADKRKFTSATIIKHLYKIEKTGQAVDWSRFISDPEKEKMILDTANNLGADKLKPIKEALLEDVTYDDIRIVMCKYKLG